MSKKLTQPAICTPNSNSAFLLHTYQKTENGLMRYKNMKYKNIAPTHFHMYFSYLLESNVKESYNFSS